MPHGLQDQVLGRTHLACLLAEQEDMYSCSARRHVLLCSLVEQEDVFLARQGDMSNYLFDKKARFLVQQEDMLACSANVTFSSSARRHALLFNQRACVLVPQEDMLSCSGQRHVASTK